MNTARIAYAGCQFDIDEDLAVDYLVSVDYELFFDHLLENDELIRFTELLTQHAYQRGHHSSGVKTEHLLEEAVRAYLTEEVEQYVADHVGRAQLFDIEPDYPE